MRKLLSILAASFLASSSLVTVVACGTSSPTHINGKKNIETEFTLTNNVVVSDDTITSEEAIFNQGKKEGRIITELDLSMFDITDSYNTAKPTSENDPPKDGYIVFTIKDSKDIPYTGSISIHFTMVKKSMIDITQTVPLNASVWDVTKYDDILSLQTDVWKEANTKFTNNAPTEFSSYNITGLDKLPTTFNKELDVDMIATYNGGSNTKDDIYGGQITIKLKIISYQANVTVVLLKNSISKTELYNLVWKEVVNFYSNDSRVSNDYNDYQIDWSGVTEPSVGSSINLNFLASPKNESAYHYIRVVGQVKKDLIKLPPTLNLPIPIVVTQAEKPNIDQNYIWNLAMKEANLLNGPNIGDFDTSNWTNLFNTNWPTIGLPKKISLIAKNRNTNPIYSGDITINVELINQGFDDTLQLKPIIFSKQQNPTLQTALPIIWQNIINSSEWNVNLSTDINNFVIDRQTSITNALTTASTSGDYATYSIRVTGDDKTAGRDADFVAVGDLKIIDTEITNNITVDLLNNNNYNFINDVSTIATQANILAKQIWTDTILDKNTFVEKQSPAYGLSTILDDWDNQLIDDIKTLLTNYNPANGNTIALSTDLTLKNKNIYTGTLTIKANLTLGSLMTFGDINLTSTPFQIFIRTIPSSANAVEELIKRIMITTWDDAVTKNKDLASNHPDFPLDASIFNYWDDEIINQFSLPTAIEGQKELVISNIVPKYYPLYQGTLTIKIKIIYQP